MEISKLYSFAENYGVTVDRLNLSENSSLSVMMDDKCFVAINKSLSEKNERVCLAHELGHCMTGSFYNIYSPLDIRGKHERRANCWAIKKLVPKYRFDAALKKGFDNIYSLAEYFDVTPDFMLKAVEYYKKTY